MEKQFNTITHLIISNADMDVFDRNTITKNFFNDNYLSFQSLEILNKYDENTRRFYIITSLLCKGMKAIYQDFFMVYNEQLFIEGLMEMHECIDHYLYEYGKLQRKTKNNIFQVNRVNYLVTHVLSTIDNILSLEL